MTAKMIRYDESLENELNEFISSNGDKIELVEDEKLKFDPYFYERQAHLQRTLKAVEDGSMKLISEEEWNKWFDEYLMKL